jgi:hypothetical protein
MCICECEIDSRSSVSAKVLLSRWSFLSLYATRSPGTGQAMRMSSVGVKSAAAM